MHSLSFPEDRGWNETAIYRGVNGYVAKMVVDIGDNVTAGRRLRSSIRRS